MDFIKTKGVLIAVTIFSLTLGEVWGVASFAQNVGINTTGNAPNSSALLDINASPGNDKGILIPRLPLTATNVGTPISPAPGAGETGLMVFNTATAGVPPNDVVPGFYYWNGTAWAPLGGGATAGGWTDDGTVVRLTTSTDFVGIGTASPAATSALDITSTTKGILIPRMTTTQRDAITTPATGLQIYNTDCQTLNYWTGTCWISTSKTLPDPNEITSAPASTTFCAGQTRTYSIPAVTGATYYVWTVPAGTSITSGLGTTSINATFGNISGNVCVKAKNSCEASGQTCLAVSVDPIPNTPGNITGITSINPGQTSVTYFVASVNGASTYTWVVPAGATIASGTGTTTIVVNFACNASSGNISVTANSTCGSSPASALALTITPLLSASAGSAVFGGVAIGGGPTATGGTTAYTYAWSPTADLSSSTVANPTALCSGSTTTYTVTVTDSRSCTATSSVVVTRNLTASAGAAKFGGVAIGGSPTATGGNPTYTYAWSPTADLSSSTVANPTALCTGSTTTYTVTTTDANSCTATGTVVVTRNFAASAGAAQFGGAAIGGTPTATGGNPTYTYAWLPATNLSSSIVANPTALCTGANTTYTITATDANSCAATSTVVVTRQGTGGTITNVGGYYIHTFTGSGTFTAGSACNVEVLVVAGGGGGGTGNVPGAGGAGGVIYNSSYAVTGGQSIAVTIGAGGSAGLNGSNSVFNTLTAIGGGRGGNEQEAGIGSGTAGGSGGGASYSPGGSDYINLGGAGQQPGFGGFGNAGGRGSRQVNTHATAGGGGAGQAGSDGVFNSGSGGKGGDGLAYSISGSSVYYGGGGGGSTWSGGSAVSTAGLGGGGIGGYYAVSQGAASNGVANTGGGGGAGYTGAYSGSGGSGIVIVRYPQ